MGEEFVFEISRRFFGCRIDEFDLWELQMERYGKLSLTERLFRHH